MELCHLLEEAEEAEDLNLKALEEVEVARP